MKRKQVAHYCIVRADLPARIQQAQLGHAAGRSSQGKHKIGTYSIILHAKNEEHLREIGWELFKAGINITLCHEPDAPWNGALMAIGCLPMDREVIGPLLKGLPPSDAKQHLKPFKKFGTSEQNPIGGIVLSAK